MNKLEPIAFAFFLAVASATLPLQVQATTYAATASKTHHAAEPHATTATKSSYWQRHPKVKSAAIGAGIGTASGALVGGLSHRGIARGAVIGAGTGAGVGLIHSSKTLNRHPYMKDAATGSAVGLGLGLAMSRGHGTATRSLGGAAIGGAAGLGIGYLRRHM